MTPTIADLVTELLSSGRITPAQEVLVFHFLQQPLKEEEVSLLETLIYAIAEGRVTYRDP